MTIYCNIYMCLPTAIEVDQPTLIPLDGATQMPVTVSYALWTQNGSKKVQLDSTDVTVSLVAYQQFLWNYNSPVKNYAEGTILNFGNAGWECSTISSDGLTGSGGCANIPPPGELTYTTQTLYLSHLFGTQQDVDNYKTLNDLTSPTFTIAASVSYNNNTWTTSKTNRNVSNITKDNETVILTLSDGTPSMTTSYLGPLFPSANTIISDDKTCIAINAGCTLVTPITQGGSGNPLSTAANPQYVKYKLIASGTAKPLDGYNNGDDSKGKWQVATTGSDGSTSTSFITACTGCGLNSLPPLGATTYYVSHSTSSTSKLSVDVALWVEYTPPGAQQTFVWKTDQTNTCCLTLWAVGSKS